MLKFTARYWSGQSRTFSAKNVMQAGHIARGLAKSNNWTLRSVGKA